MITANSLVVSDGYARRENRCLAEYYGINAPTNDGDDDFHVVTALPRCDATFGVWSAIGPFTAPNPEAAFTTPFGPEQHIDLAAHYGDRSLIWNERPLWKDGEVHELGGGDNCAWYLTRAIHASKDQDATLSLGSDDGCHVWLDGVCVLSKDVYRPIAPDQDLVRIHLSPGDHRLVMKVNNGGGGCFFYFNQGRGLPRGGILDMGAVLMQTSQSARTSPVRRGVWFLQNILGTTPPPPPPQVKAKALRADAAAPTSLSRRQILEAHRSDSLCASCHAHFDPLGFAMENYGPDGLWRTHELVANYDRDRFIGLSQGPAIDPGGALDDGRTFHDLSELKGLIMAQPRTFVRAFAKKLLAFAVGRRLWASDDPSIDAIVQTAYATNFHIRAMLKSVITSDSFRNH